MVACLFLTCRRSWGPCTLPLDTLPQPWLSPSIDLLFKRVPWLTLQIQQHV